MTTYAEFQEFYTRRVWRTGDRDFEKDLPELIRAAEGLINLDFRDRNIQDTLQATLTSEVYDLPSDVQEIIVLWIDEEPYSTPTTLQMIKNRQFFYGSNRTGGDTSSPRPDKMARSRKGQYYALDGQKVHIAEGGSEDNPLTLNITYYKGAEPYENDPENPFYDRYKNIFLAALDIQTYNYTREHELKSDATNDYEVYLGKMEEDSARRDMPSGPIDAPLPGYVM